MVPLSIPPSLSASPQSRNTSRNKLFRFDPLRPCGSGWSYCDRVTGSQKWLCRPLGLTESFDPPAGLLAGAVSVHQQADHHRRIKSRISNTVWTIPFIERLDVDLLDRVKYKPCQMAFRKPVGWRRGQEIYLVSVTRHKIVSHESPFAMLNQSI